MINIHLSGDIVRCPDISAIKKRLSERRDAENICIYGLHTIKCETYRNYFLDSIEDKPAGKYNFGQCPLAHSILCPQYQDCKKNGLMQKTFSIDSVKYRKIKSSMNYLLSESNSKVLFLTLTFPPFKKYCDSKTKNNLFSSFVHNLRENYNCGGYIAVAELGTKGTHRRHYHLLCAIPFIPFDKLNDIWCNTIKDYCDYSRNAVTSDKKTLFILDPVKAVRYVCKYFAKTRGQRSGTRIVFISNNILIKHKSYHGNVLDILKGYKNIYIQQTSDYTTAYRIHDDKEFGCFLREFLIPFFELSNRNAELYCFKPG